MITRIPSERHLFLSDIYPLPPSPSSINTPLQRDFITRNSPHSVINNLAEEPKYHAVSDFETDIYSYLDFQPNPYFSTIQMEEVYQAVTPTERSQPDTAYLHNLVHDASAVRLYSP
ncbi:hypothetical protein J6590_078719 [Homalodisca vitripennis]|nr:hypothetical protein J6590_078719 [Homalodisca vitripennis]